MVTKKCRVNRRFNSFIEPRMSDADRVRFERNAQRNADWVRKGLPR
jgi:hypothetical protein